MELRAYFFQNMYLQGIHAGIQSQHTTAEMFIKYTHALMWEPDKQEIGQACENMLYDWAENHKTTIILNGGGQGSLIDLHEFLCSPINSYPWACFYESEDALNGCMTNVGIILPDKIFNRNKNELLWIDGKGERPEELSDWEFDLVERVAACRLMN